MLLMVGSVAAQQQPRTVFRTGRELVSIDVIVRDRTGNVVRDLTSKDFEIREDGQPQEVSTFSFQEISNQLLPVASADLLAKAEAKVLEEARRAAPSPAVSAPP